MPVQGANTTLTGAAFTLDPPSGNQAPRFDRVVISNQSGYLLQVAAGPVTLTIQPWTADVVPTFGQTLRALPQVVAQLAPGAPTFVAHTWYFKSEPLDTTIFPVQISSPPLIAGSTPGVQMGTAKTFWSGGIINLTVTNTDTVYNLNFHSGWGSAAVNAASFTVPAGKQLVITNCNVSIRPSVVAFQIHFRSATTPLTSATEMYVVTIQPAVHFGAPAAGVDPGGWIPEYFGESSFVLAAGQVFAISVNCGAASAFMDLYFVGFLQDVS